MLRVQLGTTVWKRKTALSLRKQKVVPCISLVLHFCSHPVAHWKNVLAAVLYVIICAQNPNDKEIRKKSIETVIIHFRLILTASQVYMTCKMLQLQLILEYSPPDWHASDTKRITIEWLTNEYMLFFFLPSICCRPSLPFHLHTLTGNLYFANIQKSDGRGGKNYVCIVSNAVLRGLVQGDDQKIEPKQSTGNCGNRSGATHEKKFSSTHL